MKIYLSLMAGPGSFQDIDELWTPIKDYFDGIVAVYFGSRDDIEAKYLETAKGAGYITYLPYTGRHDLARTCALHCGVIQPGDWVMQVDVLERLVPEFIERHVIPWYGMCGLNPNMWLYYSKPLLFAYHESLQYQGTPHEGLRRLDGGAKVSELSQNDFFKDESTVRVNVRPLKRTDPYHWLGHYVRYYLGTPWGGNHCLLGNEHRGDPIKLYHEREALRIEVRDYLRANGVPLNEHGLRKLLTAGQIPPTMVDYINRERILNDAYRYWVLNDLTVKDDHTWAGMVKVETKPLDSTTQAG